VLSGDADDEGALGGLNDVVGDGVQVVDLQDAFDLWKEAFEANSLPPDLPKRGQRSDDC